MATAGSGPGNGSAPGSGPGDGTGVIPMSPQRDDGIGVAGSTSPATGGPVPSGAVPALLAGSAGVTAVPPGAPPGIPADPLQRNDPWANFGNLSQSNLSSVTFFPMTPTACAGHPPSGSAGFVTPPNAGGGSSPNVGGVPAGIPFAIPSATGGFTYGMPAGFLDASGAGNSGATTGSGQPAAGPGDPMMAMMVHMMQQQMQLTQGLMQLIQNQNNSGSQPQPQQQTPVVQTVGTAGSGPTEKLSMDTKWIPAMPAPDFKNCKRGQRFSYVA